MGLSAGGFRVVLKLVEEQVTVPTAGCPKAHLLLACCWAAEGLLLYCWTLLVTLVPEAGCSILTAPRDIFCSGANNALAFLLGMQGMS